MNLAHSMALNLTDWFGRHHLPVFGIMDEAAVHLILDFGLRTAD